MNRPNALLKVTSIIHIILSAVGIVLTLAGSVFAGSLVAMLYDMAGIPGGGGVGFLSGTLLFLVSIIGCVLNLIAGILGVKGKAMACRVLGVILLVLAVASFVLGISVFDKVGTIIAIAVVELCLPILYVWGAFKEPTA